MCDQTEVSYLEGDVVWVKLGGVWWPGVVKDLEKDEEGQAILKQFKTKPIACVQFFGETKYDFVKNLDHIYHYSCRKKDEFIKKGLDKVRNGVSHMQKFPDDVTKAESLTHGDVNIIHDPKFLPEEKHNYSEIFGTGKKKKKDKTVLSKSAEKVKRGKTPVETPSRRITHRRFLQKALHGETDHEVRTRIQPNSSNDDSQGTPGTFSYRCHMCRFSASRINVIVSHHRLMHSSKASVTWASDTPPPRRRQVNKSKRPKPKKIFEPPEDSDGSDNEALVKKVKTKASPSKIKTPIKSSPDAKKLPQEEAKKTPEKTPKFTEDLLADWIDDEEDDNLNTPSEAPTPNEKQEEKEEEKQDEKHDEKEPSKPEIDTTWNEKKQGSEKSQKPESDTTWNEKKQSNEKSCFDFDDDEEEGFIGMSNANTYGRMIPRVIPVKDKSELGLDLEVEALFKKKSVSSEDDDRDMENGEKGEDDQESNEKEEEEEEKEDADKTEKVVTAPVKGKRGRKRKSILIESEDDISGEDKKIDSADQLGDKKALPAALNTLAANRARRPGSRKSYLKEVIEKIEDVKSVEEVEVKKPVPTGSSRRKQDLKSTFMDNSRDEIVYSDMLSEESIEKEEEKKPRRGRQKKVQPQQTEVEPIAETKKLESEDFSLQVDNLLAETNVPSIPSVDKDKKSQVETPQKSQTADSSCDVVAESMKRECEEKEIELGASKKPEEKCLTSTAAKFAIAPQATGPSKSVAMPSDAIRKKVEIKKSTVDKPGEASPATVPSVIKTFKIKPESLSPSILASGKLKGQTILHQKGGKYVIVTQPAASRQKLLPTKTPNNKVVIIRPQHGEQILGRQGKVIATPDSSEKLTEGPSTSGAVSQHVIKVMPDGKGGIMKKVALTPAKKMIVQGSTKMIVQTSNSSIGQGSSSDFRLIENYKGTGKTVVVQSQPKSNILLKQSTVPRQGISRVIQGQAAGSSFLSLKKPKILMHTTSGHVVSDSDSQAYVMKRKAPESSFSSPKIVRKISSSPSSGSVQLLQAGESGQKTLILSSGQLGGQGGQSLIIKSNKDTPRQISSKILRVKPAVTETKSKPLQRIIHKKQVEQYPVTQRTTEQLPTAVAAGSDIAMLPMDQTQVMAMQGPIGIDGNPTYVLVTVDEHGVVQPVDNPLISYQNETEPEPQVLSNNNLILINPQVSENMPIYSTSTAGQDILAEALANTNVLDGSVTSEMEPIIPSMLLPPTIPPSVVQETSITLQKPIMTPLEIPSAVAPDTSGLEPPPLPPTPTEDVLMEEQDEHLMIAENSETKMEEQQQGVMMKNPTAESETSVACEDESQMESEPMEGYYEEGKSDEPENTPPEREGEFLIEDSQEGQGNNSFQSMPLLNDEPDTSDDAPIENQDFDSQRSRMDDGNFAPGEPPSSTNNDYAVNKVDYSYEDNGEEQKEFDSSSQDESELQSDGVKEKDSMEEEHGQVTYDGEPNFAEVISQKRFQEETEVTSTTGEFSPKV